MTRMGKVFLAVLVFMLTCFLVIGAGSSEVKAQGMKGTKLIKIWVDENDGHIVAVKLAQASGPDKDPTPVFGQPNFQYRGTILFYEKNPSCIVLVVGNYPVEFCY